MAQGGFRGGSELVRLVLSGDGREKSGVRAVSTRGGRGGGFFVWGKMDRARDVLVGRVWFGLRLFATAAVVLLLLQRKEALRGVVSKLGEGLLSTL